MKLLYEMRASTILYWFLTSNPLQGKFLLPANVCPIVPITYLKVGIEFDFVDISPRDFCMDQEETCQLIFNDKAIKGIHFVRTYGIERSFESFFQKVKEARQDIVVIDDRCLCKPDFTVPTTDSDLILHSTGYGKQVDLDWGGFGFIQENFNYKNTVLPYQKGDLHDLTRRYKDALLGGERFKYVDCGWLDTSEPPLPLPEYRRKVTRELKRIIQHKAAINQYYKNNLKPEWILADEFQNWRFHILIKNKKRILDQIFKHNLFASSHFQTLSGIFFQGRAKESERLHSRIINLFNDRHFTLEQAGRITETIIKYNY